MDRFDKSLFKVVILLATLVRLIITGNIVTGKMMVGKNMADCQKMCMPYTMSEFQNLTWRVLLWRVEIKIW